MWTKLSSAAMLFALLRDVKDGSGVFVRSNCACTIWEGIMQQRIAKRCMVRGLFGWKFIILKIRENGIRCLYYIGGYLKGAISTIKAKRGYLKFATSNQYHHHLVIGESS